MKQFFVEIARARDALKPTEAELGKSGSNLNQITHVLNTDRAPESVMNILEATLQAHFEVLQEHKQAVRDLEELRTARHEYHGSGAKARQRRRRRVNCPVVDNSNYHHASMLA